MFVLLIIILILVLLLLGITYQAIGSARDIRKYPPPGRLVDVGGTGTARLHIFEAGIGQPGPTVVLDSGLGHSSLVWSLVQPEVAAFAHVCSYDRAGYAWSDAGPRPRTSHQIVEELHTLLKNAGIAGPYVLVGHSFGALNMDLYASLYPDEVVGLVFVDALSRNISAHHPMELRYFVLTNRVKYGFLSRLTRLGAVRLFLLLKGVDGTQDFVKKLPAELQPLMRVSTLRKTFETARAETLALQESVTQAGAAHPPNDIPLVVLAHGVPDMFSGRMSAGEVQQAEKTWQNMQAELVGFSAQGKLLVAERGGHKIHIDQPELVIEAIRQVFEAATKLVT